MKQTVYITKYALSSGIMKEEMNVSEDGKVCSGRPKGWEYFGSFYGNEFFLTEKEALENAELRRSKKIESLKKQIKKLEGMEFKIKE